MKNCLLWCALALLCSSCNKAIDQLIEQSLIPQATSSRFTQYQIKKGNHSAEHGIYRSVQKSELRFMVKFDSSAIYHTQESINQFDINKLYGFSDNNADHHQYSARIGWNWMDNALHLYAYVYNAGSVCKQDLGTVSIGKEIICSIKAEETRYTFTINDLMVSVPRASTTAIAKGYMLYPYFGGDETAPHDVTISIKDL